MTQPGCVPLARLGQLSLLLLFSSLPHRDQSCHVLRCAPAQSMYHRAFPALLLPFAGSLQYLYVQWILCFAITSCPIIVASRGYRQYDPSLSIAMRCHRIALVWSFCLASVWNPIVYYHLDVLSSCMSVHHLHHRIVFLTSVVCFS